MDHDLTDLTDAGAQRQHHEHALRELRPRLVDLVRQAHAAGVPQTEIARLTGYTREQIRKMCLPPEQREAEEAARRARRRKGAREES